MLTDTHTHLYLPDFDDEPNGRAEAVRRAIASGVNRMIFPNVDLNTIEPMKSLHLMFPHNTAMAMGLHPTEVKEDWRDALSQIKQELDLFDSYCAVGEVGIDLYWDKTFEQEQMQALDIQAGWAEERNIPLIIHCREGLEQTLEVLQGHRNTRGVMHSFGGTNNDVDRIRKTVDYYFGINGVVTFKNAKVKESLDAIGLQRLLLETDSPYLSPVPKRGRRCESAYLNHTADFIADYMQISRQELEDATTSNALTLFGDKAPVGID